MLVMLHHDCLETPTMAQQGDTAGRKKADRERGIVNETQHRAYLDRHPYKAHSKDDMDAARWDRRKL